MRSAACEAAGQGSTKQIGNCPAAQAGDCTATAQRINWRRSRPVFSFHNGCSLWTQFINF